MRARPLVVTSAVVLAASGAALLGVLALSRAKDEAFAFFSREPAAAVEAPAYAGLLSNVGVLVLWAAAVACVVAGFVARRGGDATGLPLLAAGVASAYLTLDDMFQLHEELYLGELGIGERTTYAVYGLVALAFVWWFRAFLRASEWPLLTAAVALLVASAAVDLFTKTTWLEDSLKLAGIAFWAAYWIRASVQCLQAKLDREAVRAT